MVSIVSSLGAQSVVFSALQTMLFVDPVFDAYSIFALASICILQIVIAGLSILESISASSISRNGKSPIVWYHCCFVFVVAMVVIAFHLVPHILVSPSSMSQLDEDEFIINTETNTRVEEGEISPQVPRGNNNDSASIVKAAIGAPLERRSRRVTKKVRYAKNVSFDECRVENLYYKWESEPLATKELIGTGRARHARKVVVISKGEREME